MVYTIYSKMIWGMVYDCFNHINLKPHLEVIDFDQHVASSERDGGVYIYIYSQHRFKVGDVPKM